jgi:2-oxoglutarate dehydrogenase E2 component (dihydrolipoamide succinyltransferase)
MATEVTLPALGESVTEGTVTQWLKSVGDDVAVDEAILEVSTDKVDTEIPSPVAGTLLEIKVSEDETVEVGAVLAVIGDEGESAGTTSDASGEAAGAEDEGAQEASADESEGEDAEQEPAAEGEAAERQDAGSQEQEGERAPAAESQAFTEAPSEQASAAKGDAAESGDGSATEVKLPALGESVTEGTVTQWLKSVGDDVEVDEPLLEVSTDKVDTEIPSPVAGKLLEIKVSEDETVEVGAVLALVGSDGAAAPSEAPPKEEEQAPAEDKAEQREAEAPADGGAAEEEQAEPAAEEQPEPPAEEPAAKEQEAAEEKAPEPAPAKTGAAGDSGATDAKSYVTPLVRKLATQHDVDLSTVEGTGVGGRIRKQDVLAAAESAKQAAEKPAEPAAAPSKAAPAAAPEPSPLRGKTEKLSRLRKVIATRMVESLQVSAQLTTVVEVDVTAISRLRDRVKGQFEQREGVKLSFLPFFAKAAIDALKTYPQVNASIDMDEGTVTYHDGEHLGVAVDTERGLLVPVIKDAGDLSIAGIARKIADLAARTRDNKVSPDELSGGTFTLTNTGSRGALFDTPIINQPQVAILGTGTVVKRPVVISDPNLGETIAVRQMVYLALTYDHRLVDGADAARFLTAIKNRLEEAKFDAELGL